MRKLVSVIRSSTFLQHNAIVFAGAIGIGLLNYLYYPILGRMLPPSSFGEVQVLFSIFAQVLIFLNVLGLLTVNIVANYDDIKRRNRIVLELEKLALLLSSILLIVTIFSGHSLQHFFKFDSAIPFIVLVSAVVVSVPLTFRNAYLRGMKFFGYVSFIGAIAAGADLLVSIIFVLFGWGTIGAIAGLVVAQLLAYLYAAIVARKKGFTESLRSSLFTLPDFRLILPELKYALLVLIGSLAITGMYTIDTVAVKHYFDARTAGLYAGIATVARIIFFLTASVSQVLLPNIKLAHPAKQNSQTLQKSLVLLAAVGGSALLVFAIFPKLVIRILMGHAYLPYAHLLPRLSLLIFVISILNLFVMYNLALRRYVMMPVVIVGIAGTFVLLQMHHQTLQAVINSLLTGSLSMLALLALLAVWRKLQSTTSTVS